MKFMGHQFPKVAGPSGQKAHQLVSLYMPNMLRRPVAGTFKSNPNFLTLDEWVDPKRLFPQGIPKVSQTAKFGLTKSGQHLHTTPGANKFLGKVEVARRHPQRNYRNPHAVSGTQVSEGDLGFTLLHELGHATHLGNIGHKAYAIAPMAERELQANLAAINFMKKEGMKVGPGRRWVLENWDEIRPGLVETMKGAGTKNPEQYVAAYDHMPKLFKDSNVLKGVGMLTGVGGVEAMGNMGNRKSS